ncbi:hypothetical protein PAEPH01_1243 [Pancytospora epiphaga]|nr:hypothetical protein PAEPH01_1243 [Pancytospora epiphaga]
MHSTNHLLFIDDLKLLAETDDALSLMTKEVIQFFDAVSLEINKEKSATNSEASADATIMLEGKDGYKYLGIIEDNRSRQSQESYTKLQSALYTRVKHLCNTRLNAERLDETEDKPVQSREQEHVDVVQACPVQTN